MSSHEQESSPSGFHIKPNILLRVSVAHCSIWVWGLKSTCIHKKDELKAVSCMMLQFI